MFLFLFLISISAASAVQINNTTFFASETNFTILVDFIDLDAVIVSNTSIQFHNLTSIGSNFTNTNATFDARADFIGLDIGLTIRNVNTATDLFTSSISNQDFNATFTSFQVLIINSGPFVSDAKLACNTMVAEIGLWPILLGLLGTIILLGAVIFALGTGFVTLKGFGFNSRFVFFGILTVISIAILIIVAIVILGSLCVLL